MATKFRLLIRNRELRGHDITDTSQEGYTLPSLRTKMKYIVGIPDDQRIPNRALLDYFERHGLYPDTTDGSTYKTKPPTFDFFAGYEELFKI